MTIYLPPGFPESEPKLTIQPKVRHLWVDGTVTPCAVTGHEKLTPGGWSAHVNLGKLVKEISTSIQQTGVLVGSDHSEAHGITANAPNINNNQGGSGYENYSHKPPPPIPGNWSKSGPGQYSSHSSSSFPHANGSHNHYSAGGSGNTGYMSSSAGKESHFSQQSRSQNPTGYTAPVPPEMKIIKELSPEQVEEYLENPIAFENFFDQLQEVVGPRTTKRELWHGNDNISRRNLQLEAEMIELQQSTKEGYEVMMQLQKTLESKLQEQQDALWRFKPETIQSKLRSATAESDELSESIAQSFLEGKLDQEGFIRQYRELRKVYHLREMKNERIGPILRKHLANENSGLGRERSGSTLKGGAGVGIGLGSGTNSISGSGEGTGGASGHGASASSTWVMV
ncbi:Vacuolar protein sorting-associated protein 37A [Mortierella sp. NVP85]|nr:Vacuolar protein sorting-associated protein 37A [Mortierella sp. NVP85]